jgi:hypothetical protein
MMGRLGDVPRNITGGKSVKPKCSHHHEILDPQNKSKETDV